MIHFCHAYILLEEQLVYQHIFFHNLQNSNETYSRQKKERKKKLSIIQEHLKEYKTNRIFFPKKKKKEKQNKT